VTARHSVVGPTSDPGLRWPRTSWKSRIASPVRAERKVYSRSSTGLAFFRSFGEPAMLLETSRRDGSPKDSSRRVSNERGGAARACPPVPAG
jgi:hypothetical protein